MHVVISQFEVSNDMSNDVKEAFRNRPHHVEQANGFIRLDVISPQDNPDQFMLITLWTSEDDYQRWHKSHHYKGAHSYIPKGLKLKQGKTQIRHFQHICS